ncbi:carbohydrate kinase family protein [Streptomyces sp. HUAS ZL42]|uniref:carbohydrate kinase family protein n=1 Tax=Streptomyces sp. HUAS ZL42 TaxID=3231715 RepID=UPI00345F0CD3
MAEVWVLGSAAWDHVYEVDRLPAAGSTATARDLGRRAGGSTANVARGLGSAGHRVRLVAQVGADDLGAALLDELAASGVLTDHVLRHGTCTPQTLIFIDASGERSIVVLETQCGEKVPVPYEAMAAADTVYVGWFGDYGPQLLEFLRRSTALVVTAVPPANGDDWYAHVVVGSESEFPAAWLAAPYEELRRRVGPQLRWVVVTRGERGAGAYGPAGVVRIPPVVTEVADTTGAGDSFTAGLLHGLLEGEDMATAGRLGAYWAAAALPLAQSVPPGWEELGLGDAHGDWAGRLGDHAGRMP